MIQKEVLGILLDKIKTDYKDDVSILVMHGSMIYHTAHKKSDLDIYFIPKTERGYRLGFVFILEGIGYDIWPISWDRITGMSQHNEKITSIITEGQILYHASQDDLIKFEALKKIALDQSDPSKYYTPAKNALNLLYKPLYHMLTANHLKDIRTSATKIINGLCHVISLINLTMIKRGRSHLKSEVMAMDKKPAHFADLIDTLFKTDDIDLIKSSYQRLFDETALLLFDMEPIPKADAFKNQATGFYEEIINHYQKIERACQIGDTKTALFAAAEIEHELRTEIGDLAIFAELPSLVLAYDKHDLGKLDQISKKHQKMLLEILARYDVPIQTFLDIKAFKTYLDAL